jgi:hypothetical protein
MYRRELLKLLGVMPAMSLLKMSNEIEGSLRGVNSVSEKDSYNLVIYGGTPGGVSCALRAAREGVKVLLVNHNEHIGGMFVNGLGTMDTLYNGARAPIYDELRYGIYDYYRKKYGKKSKQFESSLPGFPKTRYESHVLEEIIKTLLDKEPLVSILKNYYPLSVSRSNRILSTVTFRHKESEKTMVIHADVFADCSYEGDLALVAKIPTRIGRESKEEFGEEHAGIAYMTKNTWPPPDKVLKDADFKLAREMNLNIYDSWSDLMVPESTGEADRAIQAFCIRTTLTDDPGNRIIPERPDNYDPDYFRKIFTGKNSPGLGVPNQKTSWMIPELIGEQNSYVEGDWLERQKVTKRFRDITLGLLYFIQNDPSVEENTRENMQKFGLPKDEYKDNGNMPYEVYVREARRIVGRSVFTENDAILVKGLQRTPIQTDSISITEWFMDSHACTEKTIEGSKPEGEVMLKNKTFPAQISFNCILPEEVDNLIVPVCLSSSHIGWGAIRLEPTWMSIGEAAGYTVAMAIKEKISPAKIDKDKLLRTLAKSRLMISFFNDVEGREYSSWYPAVQYLGTKGFFGTYEANVHQTLSSKLANVWLLHISRWISGRSFDPNKYTKDIFSVEHIKDDGMKASVFVKHLSEIEGFQDRKISLLLQKLDINPDSKITRGDASRLIFETSANE